MRADDRYKGQNKTFWANVRSISEKLGYTNRRTKEVKVYSYADMKRAMRELGLQSRHLFESDATPSPVAQELKSYFEYRARVLNTHVKPRLMKLDRAKETYRQMLALGTPNCPQPKNKQKGDKAGPAYLTCIVNLLIERHCEGIGCAYAPNKLTTFTLNEAPLRTLARRVDGCFPGTVDPLAIWEIKEYYSTTTFGSRVAGGVYETLLDGLELEDVRELGVPVEHLFIVDAYQTWWEQGRSYLCRMVDLLQMGYVDEVLFGYEVIERMPDIVAKWVAEYRRRNPSSADARH